MEGGWLISYVALWLLVIAAVLTLLVHSRLLGILHQRLGPSAAKALSDGPEVGEVLRSLDGKDLDGADWSFVFPSGRPVLAVFISPQCDACGVLMPHVKDYWRSRGENELLLISTIPHQAMNRAYVDYLGLLGIPYLLGGDLAHKLNIEGTPYAVAFDAGGRVIAKGLVNHFEHLISLQPMARD